MHSSTSSSTSATGDTDGADAGFQECSNLGMEVTVAEYRNGNGRRTACARSPV